MRLGAAGTSGSLPFGQSLASETTGGVDTFAMIEIARQAKADYTLVFHTRARAWLPFSSDPLH
jgi:hypothetical protein